jgi:hypothetical protein
MIYLYTTIVILPYKLKFKIKKNVKIILSAATLAFMLNACKKGDTGPQGNIGPAGPTGSPNVIYSAWQTSPTASRDTTIDGTCMRIRHLSAPALDTAMIKRCVMMTYFRVGSIGPYQLPYISDAGGAMNEVNCIYNVKKIFVYRHTFGSCRFTSASAGTEPVLINLPQSLEYRYVLIPGSIAGGRLLQADATYDITALKKLTYAELIQKLDIPENGSND